MDAMTANALKTFAKAITALEALPMVGAEAYANGGYRAAPIVDRHFTPGNQDRYGWPPLSEKYSEQKRGQRKMLRAGMKASGFKVSKLDEDAFGSATLPMLVRTGRLRSAVTSKGHSILRDGDTAVIVFNVPDYGLFLHTGTARMPKRSPVEPNDEDRAAVVAAMQRQLDVAIGTGGDVPVSISSIPGKARIG